MANSVMENAEKASLQKNIDTAPSWPIEWHAYPINEECPGIGASTFAHVLTKLGADTST